MVRNENRDPFETRNERRTKMLTVRLTDQEDSLLNQITEELQLDRADLVRQALNHWLRHGPEAARVQPLLKG